MLPGYAKAVKFPSIILVVSLLVSGCAGRVVYLNDSGKELSQQWTGSYELAACPFILIDGKKYQTPSGRYDELIRDIKPLLNNYAFCPPDLAGQVVQSWSGIKMKNGDVLVCGGTLKGKVPNDRSWFVDSRTKQIRTGPKLVYPCLSPSMLLLKSGSILVTGGFSDHSDKPIALAQLFAPETGKFRALPKMCLPRVEHEMVQLDNDDVLVVAGRTSSEHGEDQECGLTSTVELFDRQNERFQMAGELERARKEPIVKPLSSTEALVAGGFYVRHNIYRDDRWIRDWEIFSIAPKSHP